MHFRRISAIALAGAALAGTAPGIALCQEENHAESLRADAPHPRIFLGARHLRLLRRERERQSLRWNQFHLLMAGKAPMPEPGFAQALYYQVSGSAEAGPQAVAWALGAGADLRQLALVFDWCQDILTEAQAKTLSAKIARGIQQSRRDTSVSAVRSRLLAAVALSGHLPDLPEREIAQVVHQWWEGGILPAINGGREAVARDDTYALMEILHVVRDNFKLDLREGAPQFFTDLPMVHLLSYYPATFPAGENDYRISAAPRTGAPAQSFEQPDLRRAALSRAAELSMVAYDSNGPGSQILQGWLMNDHFLLRGTFGAPYEFLWANPYQPGLSYFQAPLVVHDSLLGRLFVRSGWDESAAWLGFFSGELQMFQEGGVTVLDPNAAAEPLDLGRAVILFGAHTRKFKVAAAGKEPVFVVGLKPRQHYLIEVDDEELSEEQSDPGGILDLDVPHDREVGVRLRATSP
ncbi:MAG TPA: hypothetical protein VN924_30375 [Bryobacteraceae bacterium]|nr:hypothetical protein [Bryobacteraceae bacterium]